MKELFVLIEISKGKKNLKTKCQISLVCELKDGRNQFTLAKKCSAIPEGNKERENVKCLQNVRIFCVCLRKKNLKLLRLKIDWIFEFMAALLSIRDNALRVNLFNKYLMVALGWFDDGFSSDTTMHSIPIQSR